MNNFTMFGHDDILRGVIIEIKSVFASVGCPVHLDDDDPYNNDFHE